MKTYSQPILKLLALLLRPKTNYHLVLPTSITHILSQLQQGFNNNTHLPSTLATQILHLLITLWTQTWSKTPSGNFTDPTLCLLALVKLRLDGSFVEPRLITGTIAQLQYCMRMVFVGFIHSQANQNTPPDFDTAWESTRKWLVEKESESTFNSLRSLQHRASAIAYDTMSLPRIWWTDRTNFHTMLYKGDKISLNEIQSSFQAMELDLVKLWETNILCGLSLKVAYSELADNLTDTSVGYSFLSDSRNHCFREKDLLAKSILLDENLKTRFLIGAFSEKPVWNILALKTWLTHYAHLHAILLARCEMLGGAASRGTEMTAMTYKNTKTRTSRNFVAMGKYLVFLCMYHKGSALTGKDKLIPHALDAFTSDLLVQDLAIARPFAELAVHVCYPDNTSIAKMYRDLLFINNTKLFDTSDLTFQLKKYTNSNAGISLGVNAWRHISIAFRYVKFFCKAFYMFTHFITKGGSYVLDSMTWWKKMNKTL